MRIEIVFTLLFYENQKYTLIILIIVLLITITNITNNINNIDHGIQFRIRS